MTRVERCFHMYRATWDGELVRCELPRRHKTPCGPLSKPALAQEHSETSKAAARQIEPHRAPQRARVYDFIRSRGGATDEEVQQALKLKGDSERARRIELVAGALVVDSGRTRTTSSGKQAVVWIAAGQLSTGIADCG